MPGVSAPKQRCQRSIQIVLFRDVTHPRVAPPALVFFRHQGDHLGFCRAWPAVLPAIDACLRSSMSFAPLFGSLWPSRAQVEGLELLQCCCLCVGLTRLLMILPNLEPALNLWETGLVIPAGGRHSIAAALGGPAMREAG